MPNRRTSAIRWGLVGLIAFCAAGAASTLGAVFSGLPFPNIADGWPLLPVYVAIMMVPWALHAYFGGRYWNWAFAFTTAAWLCTAYWAYAIQGHQEYMQSRGFPVDGLGLGVAVGFVFQLNMILGAGSLNFGVLAIAEGGGAVNWTKIVAIGILAAAPTAWLYTAVVGFSPIFRWFYQ